jgi:hypothetical protein
VRLVGLHWDCAGWGWFADEVKRWGRGDGCRGGKAAKKRAVVAVARKLSVLLHRLWVTGEEYQAIGYGKSAQEAA